MIEQVQCSIDVNYLRILGSRSKCPIIVSHKRIDFIAYKSIILLILLFWQKTYRKETTTR